MRRKGFTLVELMIVVAIIGVLSVVAGTAYRRYMDAGRTAEAMAMLGEFRAKEEAYRAENGVYLPTGTNENASSFFPTLLGSGIEPRAKSVATPPATWSSATVSTLGISPIRQQLYCGYVVLAGAAGVLPTGATDASLLLGGVAAPVPWWVAVATCDNDSDGNANHNAYFTTGSPSSSVVVKNEHW